jgi:uncharacterized protein (TIGR03790 family)
LAGILSTVILRVALFLFSSVVHAWPASAQTAENVAIVVNDLSAESRAVGEHYARVRSLPAENVFHIKSATTEAITRNEYVRTIEQPLSSAIRRAGLQDRLLYLVLTKGVAHRITGTTGLQGTSGSVDSELTLLYRRLTGHPVPAAGIVDNPYFLGARPIADAKRFSRRDHDLYLVTRLDAFSQQEAIALIDRAQQPKAEGAIVLDQAAGTGVTQTADQWLATTAARLREQGHETRVVLDEGTKAVRSVDAVLGYSGWGVSDPEQRVRRRLMAFLPGSIATTFSSSDARTFHAPPDAWTPSASGDKNNLFEGASDNLLGDLIRDGATGVAGQVGEAYLAGSVHPEILFPAYLAGFNFAEASYLASPALSWQQVIVGDPLMTPFEKQRLTRQDVDGGLDPQTGLPAFFSQRRLVVARRANPTLPANAVALLVRAETAITGGDAPAARAALDSALALAPKSLPIRLMLAGMDEQAGAYDAAMDHYRAIVDMDPSNVIALNNLAYGLAVHASRADQALVYARKAAALAPRAGTVLDTLGWVEHLSGNGEAAARALAAAIQLEPDQAEYRLHAAVVHAAAGRTEQSRTELAEALRLDPSLESREEVQALRRKP